MTQTPTGRPMTLDGVVAEFERLLAEARDYPVDAHGYPGQEVADAWYRRERDINLWARTLVKRLAPDRFEVVPWVPSSVSTFPGRNWEIHVRHLDRLIGALRNLDDELELLGPAPAGEPAASEPAPRAPLDSGPGWLARHGWQALSAGIGLAGLAVAIVGVIAAGGL